VETSLTVMIMWGLVLAKIAVPVLRNITLLLTRKQEKTALLQLDAMVVNLTWTNLEISVPFVQTIRTTVTMWTILHYQVTRTTMLPSLMLKFVSVIRTIVTKTTLFHLCQLTNQRMVQMERLRPVTTVAI